MIIEEGEYLISSGHVTNRTWELARSLKSFVWKVGKDDDTWDLARSLLVLNTFHNRSTRPRGVSEGSQKPQNRTKFRQKPQNRTEKLQETAKLAY